MAKASFSIHIHEWLYDKVMDMCSKGGFTQAEAMDELYLQADRAVIKYQQELETLKKENNELKQMLETLKKENEQYKKEFEETTQVLKQKR